MGLNDTAEQLDACRQQSIRDEARITELERELAAAGTLIEQLTRPAQPTEPAQPTDEQREFWEVTGGIGGRRIDYDLPSRDAAERVARDFSDRLRRLPVPETPIRIRLQSGRYGPEVAS